MANKHAVKQSLEMRRNYVGRTCKLHFEAAPLKIERASRQYMYGYNGEEYLDCISIVSPVGHCHPHVVHTAHEQMLVLTTCDGFLSDVMAVYAKRIVETLPDQLSVCLFVNSGSEANDLALRLARNYTNNEDVVVVENAFHGNTCSLLEISPRTWESMGLTQKDWVHTVPCPNTYRGMYREDTDNVGVLYANEVQKVIMKCQGNNRRIAAFVVEPLMSTIGVINPPKQYLKQTFRYIRDSGGICIADEVQVGLGRTGDKFWSFQLHGVVPDILTVGPYLGNGFPMAMLITTIEIADTLHDIRNNFGGNPVACAVGMAVLDVIDNETLMSSAKSVGKCLLDGFKAIEYKHPMLGEIRGMGLIIGVEIVKDKQSRKPYKQAAEILSYRLKEKNILIVNDGPDENVMIISPPMCFTCDNARHVVATFDVALSAIENTYSDNDGEASNIPMDILTSGPSVADSDTDIKQAIYEDND